MDLRWTADLIIGLPACAVWGAPVLVPAGVVIRRLARRSERKRAAKRQMRCVLACWLAGSWLCVVGGHAGLLPTDAGSEVVWAPILWLSTAAGWLVGWWHGRGDVAG